VIEREVKLSAWPGFRLPDLDGVAKGARTRRRETVDLDATYFDTADLRLGRRGITLRHRRRGARETWTLKLPVESSDPAILARSEIDVTGPPGDVPAELALLVAAETRTASLVKVARLMTVRRRTLVLDRDEMPLAEIDDDEVSVMDGGRVAARFRELEVEIAPDADDAVAGRIVDRLVAAGAELAGSLPKLARAVGPRFLQPAEAAPGELVAEPTAGHVVTHALRAGATRLIEHHPAAVIGVDPEGVHQMRVGARRLRSDLRTFRPLLDRDVTDPVRDQLRWLGEVLGAVRDPDVLGDQLRAVAATVLGPDEAPVLDGVVGRLTASRDTAVAELHDVLGSDRYRRLLDQVVALAEDPPLRRESDERADGVLPGLVAKPWRALRQEVDALGDEPEDAALHEVRKGAKQVRYATETVTPVVGRPARKAAKGVRRVQDVLGDHQDTVVAEEWLRTALATDEITAPEAFALGLLVAGERARRAELRAAWPETWEKAAAGDRWAWLP
jgi:CHAD domain-containing protein